MQGFEVVERFPMQWGEMDALGHANNTRYFAWFESARISYFRRIGVDTARSGNIGPILATTSCDFIRPIVFPAALVVGARVTRVGTKSIAMEYQVALAGDEEQPYAKGTSTVVMFDYGAERSVAIPEELRERIALLDSSAVARP